MPLTAEQRKIITATVPIVAEHGQEVTEVFYSNLLTEHPELRNVFAYSSQVTLRQPKALAGSLCAYASHINDLTPILAVVDKINHKHASVQILPEQYPIVGQGVLRAFRTVLGPDVFTDEVSEAWGAAYNELANLMIEREEAIFASCDKLEGGWRGWRKMTLARKVKESDEVSSFYLVPSDGGKLPVFKPGQYISVKVKVPNFNFDQIRQYSLSDSPESAKSAESRSSHLQNPSQPNGAASDVEAKEPLPRNSYRISVKRDPGSGPNEPGFVSNILHSYNEGDVLEISNPTGEFFLHLESTPPTAPIVLISAGVGLTPLISILKTLLQPNTQNQPNGIHPQTSHSQQRPISWIHTARNYASDPFTADITSLALANPNLRAKVYLTKPDPASNGVNGSHSEFEVKGRLNISEFSEGDKQDLLHVDDDTTLYFVCGPDQFMIDVEKALERLGVQKDRIKMELFGVGSVSA